MRPIVYTPTDDVVVMWSIDRDCILIPLFRDRWETKSKMEMMTSNKT